MLSEAGPLGVVAGAQVHVTVVVLYVVEARAG